MNRSHEANKSFFDKWSRTYDRDQLSAYFIYCHERLFPHLNPKGGGIILDLGCGTGEAVLRLGEGFPECKIFGVDISIEMLKRGITKAGRRKNVFFQTGESGYLPFKSDYFDLVFTTNSFHHYREPVESLKEIRRILKKRGAFFILDVCRDRSLGIKLWDVYHKIVRKGHNRYYSSEEIGNFLDKAGFSRTELLFRERGFRKYNKLFFSIQLWKGIKD